MDFRTIIQSTEKKYLYLILILCLLHALHGFIYTCIPFIFYDPILTCKKTVNGTLTTFLCDQNTACDNYPYSIDLSSSFYSITTEFELICSRRYYKPVVQSVMLAGTTISGLSMSFIKVNPYKRPRIMQICYILGSILFIISTLLSNLWLIAILLFFSYLFSYVWYANIYTYASETFEPPLKKIVPSILTSFFGMGTMVFSITTLVIKDWRILIAFYYGIPTFIFSIIFFFHDKTHGFEPKNIELEQELDDLQVEKKAKGLLDIFKDKSLARNFLVYVFLWNMNSISYNGCDIALGSLSGSLVFTMFFLGAVQAICSFVSGNLVLKFQEETLLKLTTVLMAFFFLLYIFEPQNKLNVELYISVLFTIFMIIANIGIELNWTILVNLLQKYIPLDFQQNVFAFGDMCAMMISLILPYYIEFTLYIGLSPIFGFGLVALIGRFVIGLLVNVVNNEAVEEKLLKKKKSVSLIKEGDKEIELPDSKEKDH